jgi:mRNA interferase RelE/StbE
LFWQFCFTPSAEKEFKKLDTTIQKQIKNYLFDMVLKSPNPLLFAKPLQSNLANVYRFRVRNFRILCTVQKTKMIITVVKVGHRSTVYKN